MKELGRLAGFKPWQVGAAIFNVKFAVRAIDGKVFSNGYVPVNLVITGD